MRRAGTSAVADGEPTLHELRSFVQLAEDLHFGRAAARLGVSQPTLSESIRRLEERVGGVLFERSSRRVTLTARGERALSCARVVLDGLADIGSAPEETAPEVLRVGIEANGFAELTGPVLAAIHARHPETPLVIRECDASPTFFTLRLDVALVRSRSGDERLRVHEVAVEPRGVLVPAGHPRAGTAGSSIVDFLDEPFVAVAPRAPAIRHHWLATEHRGGEPPRIAAEAASLQEVVHAVAHLGAVTTAGRSIPRSLPPVGVGFAEVVDLAPTPLGVAARADDARPIIAEVVDIARRVVARLAGRVPDVSPIARAGATVTRRGRRRRDATWPSPPAGVADRAAPGA